ncbi:JAB domain-containing protein [Flavobacterium sp. CYK-4]|uniref:JAB domain-containing protein n=1 Tax=Flavobacterium lotistagni TaxID=2709660 RepID=UPI001408D91F|nr:JAB domain-containing protein [Flavobacterium lotistagni]NHM06553.1 JAB domain-containing protein [Flavobacterium lotistagni]
MNNKISEIKVSYNARTSRKEKIKSSLDASELLMNSWNKSTMELYEEFKVLYLNNSNEVLGIYPLSKGGITGTVVDVRLIFSVALKCNAVGIILAHNHPSGNLKPSENDKAITRKIKNASDFLDIKLLDHLIITKSGYYSFSDEGII